VTRLHDPLGGGGAGDVTVSVALPVFPSLVAITLAVPAADVVTKPLAETPATDGADDDHAMDRPVKTFPAASLRVAVACVL
jgi:hypothetical protein